MNILGHFGGHVGSLGVPFGLVFAPLGSFSASFWLSWGVLERLFSPSWPKSDQDTEKNLDFWFYLAEVGSTWESKLRKIDVQSSVFFRCVSDIDFY